MARALIGCPRCGFVARKYSYVGAKRQCPECRGPMHDVTASQARAMLADRGAGPAGTPPHGDPVTEAADSTGE